MRRLGTTFLVRRATSTWLLLACVAVTVLVATVLAAALWTFEADPASLYWALDLLPTSGIKVSQVQAAAYGSVGPSVVIVSYGPALVSPAAFSDGLAVGQASWFALPQTAAMARGKVGALAESTTRAMTHLAVSIRPYGLQVSTGLPRLLTGAAGR